MLQSYHSYQKLDLGFLTTMWFLHCLIFQSYDSYQKVLQSFMLCLLISLELDIFENISCSSIYLCNVFICVLVFCICVSESTVRMLGQWRRNWIDLRQNICFRKKLLSSLIILANTFFHLVSFCQILDESSPIPLVFLANNFSIKGALGVPQKPR